MSVPNPRPETDYTATGQTHGQKQQRVLACVLCQQRKTKCDRKFPCANCVRAGAQCVPATLGQRRRRFPERELLERLRFYEGLLNQHHIAFDPLHPPTASAAEHMSPSDDGKGASSVDDAHFDILREKTTVRYKAVDFFHAVNQMTLNPTEHDIKGGSELGDEDDYEDSFQHENDGSFGTSASFETDHKPPRYKSREGDDLLLFSPPLTNLDLSTLHPNQIQMFKLWQIYLDNVDPLLKVTHTPTLQARIIDAAGDVTNIPPTLEALMFSIYCIAIESLAEDDCPTLLGASKQELLKGYQFACQQAILNCRTLRSADRDSLTALYLYLVTVRLRTDPQALASVLAIAIRKAQCMGMHLESTYSQFSVLEGEINRRLWWALVILDQRTSEMSDYKVTSLVPTWDCKPPSNVNDFELRREMKTPPAVHDKPTEAIFAVVRSELADFVRHSTFHLNFVNPTLNTMAQPRGHQRGSTAADSELEILEKMMEDKYLAFCDLENPLHFMTIWTTRAFVSRNRLLELYSKHSTSSTHQTDFQREAAFDCALRMLKCDTELLRSPLAKGFHWFVNLYIPALAYVHVLNGLLKRPEQTRAAEAWKIMSDNYEARTPQPKPNHPSVYLIYRHVLLKAWEGFEAEAAKQNKTVEPPAIVKAIRRKVMLSIPPAEQSSETRPGDGPGVRMVEPLMPTLTDFGGQGTDERLFAGLVQGGYLDMPGQNTMDVDMDQFWNTTDWRFMQSQGW